MKDLFSPPHPGLLAAAQLAEVVDVDDPERLARVQIRLLSADGVDDHDAPIWARVATAFAGADYGAFFIPDVGDEVLVTFVNGDARLPIVIGSLWNGKDKPPESLPGGEIDRWTITGHQGTRIAIEEESGGSPTISFTTPGGVSGTITDEAGGKIELSAAGSTITMTGGEISIQTGGKVKVEATQVEVTAGMVKVDSAFSQFSGVVKCEVLQATSVISASYTPGAGNIW